MAAKVLQECLLIKHDREFAFHHPFPLKRRVAPTGVFVL
jgi:hypothetical protein